MNTQQRVNPFGARIGNQELQPSQIRKNKQAQLKLQKSKMQGQKKPNLTLGSGALDQ